MVSRRQVLKASLITAAVGSGIATAGTATATTRPEQSREKYPDIPGMLGDRRANEFWYQFDENLIFRPTQELLDAYTAMGEVFGRPWSPVVMDGWLSRVGTPDYPNNFTEFMRPIEPQLRLLSTAQLEVIDRFYFCDDRRLVRAFADFGQGVLYDPRRGEAHTMNGDPVVGYHHWHIFLRAMMFLDIDRERWAAIAPLNAFAWAVQAVAKPIPQQVNPALPRRTVNELGRYWLNRTPSQLDQDFMSVPNPPGTNL